MLARIQYENVDKQYARMRALKNEVDQLVHSPVTRWYKEVITDFSIHAKEDRNRDDLLFKIYQQYLAIYVDMVQQAQPQSPDLSKQQNQGIFRMVRGNAHQEMRACS